MKMMPFHYTYLKGNIITLFYQFKNFVYHDCLFMKPVSATLLRGIDFFDSLNLEVKVGI